MKIDDSFKFLHNELFPINSNLNSNEVAEQQELKEEFIKIRIVQIALNDMPSMCRSSNCQSHIIRAVLCHFTTQIFFLQHS